MLQVMSYTQELQANVFFHHWGKKTTHLDSHLKMSNTQLQAVEQESILE
jgi:hypothetical protein